MGVLRCQSKKGDNVDHDDDREQECCNVGAETTIMLTTKRECCDDGADSSDAREG